MKRILSFLSALFVISALSFRVQAQEQEYIQVDWYPLLTDSVGWNITSGGLAFGFVDAVASDAEVKPGKSFEISWLNVVGAKYNTGHGQRISVGVGLDWKNYKLATSQHFAPTDNGISLQPYPEGATKRSSRLKVFALELPVIVRQRFGRYVDVFAGEITNFNLHSSLLTTYTTSEGKVKESVSKNLHTSKVTFDVIGGVNYRKVGLYLRYSPCPVIKNGFGPKLNTLSWGIVLGL
ncbi:MAG: hypothetical protein ACI30R_08175 [Sodaliphilus sp.]